MAHSFPPPPPKPHDSRQGTMGIEMLLVIWRRRRSTRLTKKENKIGAAHKFPLGGYRGGGEKQTLPFLFPIVKIRLLSEAGKKVK